MIKPRGEPSEEAKGEPGEGKRDDDNGEYRKMKKVNICLQTY